MFCLKKAVLMLSGGPDSTALAYWVKSQGYELHTLTFNFGEKEGEAERRSAEYFARQISTSHRFISFEDTFKDFYMNGDPIHILRMGEDTMTPIKAFGAGIALSLAASYASEIGAEDLFYAVHKDDTIYRENNKEFFDIMSKAISIETGKHFTIHTPFLDKTKAEVLKVGIQLGVSVDETWSCASNSSVHCGKCAPCLARKNAFEQNGIVDSTLYSDVISESLKVAKI